MINAGVQSVLSVFSRVRTDYGDLWRKFVYFVPIPENTGQIYEFGPFHTVFLVVSPLNNEKY